MQKKQPRSPWNTARSADIKTRVCVDSPTICVRMNFSILYVVVQYHAVARTSSSPSSHLTTLSNIPLFRCSVFFVICSALLAGTVCGSISSNRDVSIVNIDEVLSVSINHNTRIFNIESHYSQSGGNIASSSTLNLTNELKAGDSEPWANGGVPN